MKRQRKRCEEQKTGVISCSSRVPFLAHHRTRTKPPSSHGLATPLARAHGTPPVQFPVHCSTPHSVQQRPAAA
ncbi:hypothetical protein BDA96_01G453600 [Sorghum bicolor]|uniref:Uncharacterized protein n=2 Tax=Sorghum bicolor TaxID=4558 RepID=A0A921S532_SORBI|nr:hypothetical protein BDA96_01G453600 [Sorghum bicolor]OQU92864.1 hypothetical protein SORBI_3001G425750 [Sorghum bicolor]